MPGDRTGGAERGRPPRPKAEATRTGEGREARQRPLIRGSDGPEENERGSVLREHKASDSGSR